MSVLLLDVGNTRVKWGVGEGGEIHRTGYIAQEKIRADGIGVLTARLPRDVDAVVAANVAGQTFGTRLSGVLGAHTGREVQYVQTTRAACGVSNGYAQPRRLGIDRWLALIGAWTELRGACLVVDAGTAVTIDALTEEGVHLGGQILPGLHLMSAALTDNTAQIPPVPPGKPEAFADLHMFATNTRSAVQAGVQGAIAGAVERAIATLRDNAYDAEVVLTGGDAARIGTALGETALHRPHLALTGLLQVYETGPERRA